MSTRTFDTDQQILTVYASEINATTIRQPFPLQGSKRKQAAIINMLRPTTYNGLLEPFCGTAAATLYIRSRGFQGATHINDLNQDIAQLWMAIVDSPEELAHNYTDVWSSQFLDPYSDLTSREYFNIVRQRFNESSDRSSADFLFILNRIVKGALRYNKKGDINQSADGRRVGAKPKETTDRIMEASAKMQGVTITSLDWRECTASASKGTFVYLDPPYQGTTDTNDKRYIEGLSYDEFRLGVEDLVQRDIGALISYDAIVGPATYGRALHLDVDLLALDIVTGVSSQGTLLGRNQEAHETLYLTPQLVKDLGGQREIASLLTPPASRSLFDTLSG